ncbi:hypothetical protein HYW41_02745 [Candidatus Daviesbacteria bacterium]|nr:hypothetical protein [Candidatus Daviesbacteria bacterium]
MINQKGFTPVLILLGAILITGIVGGAYYLGTQRSQPTSPTTTSQPTPTSNPTANGIASWGIYKNTKIGFEISYPNGKRYPYYVKGPDGGNTYTVDGTEDNEVVNFPGNSPHYDAAYFLKTVPFSGTLEEVVAMVKKDYGYSVTNKATLISKDFKIAGNDVLWYKIQDRRDRRSDPGPNPGEEEFFEILMVAKNHAFIFHSIYGTDEKLMDQILSTFKFLDQ